MTDKQKELARNQAIRRFGEMGSVEALLCPLTKQAGSIDSLWAELQADPTLKDGAYAMQLQADLGTYNTMFQFNLDRGDIVALRRVLVEGQKA